MRDMDSGKYVSGGCKGYSTDQCLVIDLSNHKQAVNLSARNGFYESNSVLLHVGKLFWVNSEKLNIILFQK